MLDPRQIKEKFELVKDLDSMVFVEIPQREIVDSSEYGYWLIEEVEMKWITKFNQGNERYYPRADFNQESSNGIYGFFGGIYIDNCKIYRYDGTGNAISEDDYRGKRGYLIRDHYSERDVVKVQLITNNLVEFLEQEGIKHLRTDFKRRK